MMKRAIWLIIVAVLVTFGATSHAQTNDYISTGDGFWDEARLWSLAAPPSADQSAISVTNSPAKNITIDSITAASFADTLTISNLIFSSGAANVLYLDNTGTTALHVLNGLHVGGLHLGGSGTLIASNSTLIVDGSLGDKLENDGTMVFVGGMLVTTNCNMQVGNFDVAPGLLILSNAVLLGRDLSLGGPNINGGGGGGNIVVSGGTVTLSSTIG
jgi:hypothetical protein